MWRNAIYALAAFTANAQQLCTLQDPENGSVQCHQAFGIRMCEINCNEGYTLDDNRIYACSEVDSQAIWSPAIQGDRFPSCIEIDQQCNDLTAPENGFIHCEEDPESGDK
jgi:hypothetical protein